MLSILAESLLIATHIGPRFRDREELDARARRLAAERLRRTETVQGA